MWHITVAVLWLIFAGVGCRRAETTKLDAISLLDFVERATPGLSDLSAGRPAHRLLTFSGEKTEAITFPVGSQLSVPVEIRPGTILGS